MSSVDTPFVQTAGRGSFSRLLRLLWRDKVAALAMIVLVVVLLCCIFGPLLMDTPAKQINLRTRNLAPLSLEHGWLFVLGSDPLGRSVLARVIVGARNTIMISGAAAVISLVVGAVLGLCAGFLGSRVANLIMRLADIVMSFPSLLLALVVLYVLGTSIINVILILAITRVPLYLRVTRAEVLEIRERLFVKASQVLGASRLRLLFRHIAPTVLPTLLTLAALDLAFLILAESSLSFLGLGVQPPEMTWGVIVAEGKDYLGSAWWIAFWPGLAITVTTVALNLVSDWLRVVLDPQQRWRLEVPLQ